MHLVLLGLDLLFPHLVVHLDQVESLLDKASDHRVLVVEQLEDHVHYLSLLKHDLSGHSEEQQSVVGEQDLLHHLVDLLLGPQ